MRARGTKNLTPEQRAEIVSLYVAGEKVEWIAAKCSVVGSTVSRLGGWTRHPGKRSGKRRNGAEVMSPGAVPAAPHHRSGGDSNLKGNMASSRPNA